MKTAWLGILVLAISRSAFADAPPLNFGTPFKRINLEIRWDVPIGELRKEIWVYRTESPAFSESIVSNVTSLGAFTAKERTFQDTGQTVYKNAGGARYLSISQEGNIRYEVQTHHTHTNLAEGVPSESEAVKLTEGFLPKIGIDINEIKGRDGGKPGFYVDCRKTTYYVNSVFITNIERRVVRFQRLLDGFEFLGNHCEIDFGDMAQMEGLLLTWPRVEREGRYSVASPETLMKRIRQGQAVQNMVFGEVGTIDWNTVKSMEVTGAKLCYVGIGKDVVPIVALWTTVNTGAQNVQVEIDCPAIESGRQ